MAKHEIALVHVTQQVFVSCEGGSGFDDVTKST